MKQSFLIRSTDIEKVYLLLSEISMRLS